MTLLKNQKQFFLCVFSLLFFSISTFFVGAAGTLPPEGAKVIPVAGARADMLSVVSWGGAYAQSQEKTYILPYLEQGHKVSLDNYNGSLQKIRDMIRDHRITWDVVDVESQSAVEGCVHGLFEKVNWDKLDIDPSNFDPSILLSCAVPNTVSATVIAYDKSVLSPSSPLGVKDFFDTKTFPGKRGLRRSPVVALEWALIADGVPLQDVYDVLKTPRGIDRAFKKLDTLKKDIVWWDSGADSVALLKDKSVVMTSAWNGRIYAAQKSSSPDFALSWKDMALDTNYWAIVRGTPFLTQAYDFIRFASAPKRMALEAETIAYGPTNRKALALLESSVLSNLPNAPENMKHYFRIDPYFWEEYSHVLEGRFSLWVTGALEEEEV